MQRRIAHGLAVAVLIAGLGAAQGPNNSEAKPAPSNPPVQKPEAVKQAGKPQPYQVGTASWYGEYFDGKPTASGEPYDMYDMTAASLTIPLGTFVKVTNLHNGKAIVVKVNDRGPVVPGRIIDLSYGAATALHFEKKGLQRVRIDLVKTPQHKATYQTVAYNHLGIELAP
jgi:rare lipoprotein A